MSTAAPSLRTFVAGLVGGLLLGRVVGALGLGEEELVSAGSLGASVQHLLLEHFARAVLLARDVGDDRPIGESRVHFLPGLGGVRDESAVLRHLGGEGEVEVLRLESPVVRLGVDGEDDAVIAELDLDDLLHAVLGAIGDLFFLDLARGIGDVDGGVAEALAELLDAGAGAAQLDDRGLEVAVGLAELLSHDVGVGQNGRRAGDLDLVAGDSRASERYRADNGRRRCARDELCAHTGLLLEVMRGRADDAPSNLSPPGALAPWRLDRPAQQYFSDRLTH